MRRRGHAALGKRERRGQVLALIVMLIPVFVGGAGLAVDLSNVMMHRRKAQNAADLAALAAAAKLPDLTAARTAAFRVAAANGHKDGVNGVHVTVTNAVGGDSTLIQVAVSDSVPTLFMRMFGNQVSVASRPATAKSGAPPAGVYAVKTGCSSSPSSVAINLSSSHFSMPVYSDANLTVSGTSNIFDGPVTYACTANLGTGSNTYKYPPHQNATEPTDPLKLAQSAFPCTYNFTGSANIGTNGAWWSGGTTASKQLMPGVYCSTGSLSLTTVAGVQGNVTFVAATTVTISGSAFALTPFTKGVLVAAYGTGASLLSGVGGTWTGMLYAPNGTLSFTSSSNWTVNGGLVAAAITMSGSGMTLGASTIPTSGTQPTLVK